MTNLLLVLRKSLLDKSFNLNQYLQENIENINYIKNVLIAKAGFINIIFQDDFIFEKINNVLNEVDDYGKNSLGKNKKINIEFVSANPTGPIHLGHMRGAVYGDVLANILEKYSALS